MNPLIAKLNAVLLQEAALHQKLLEEAEAKRAAIIAGRLPEMEQILERERAIIAEVNRFEERRQELVLQTREKYQITQEPFKLQQLADLLGEEGKELAQTRQLLKEVLDKLRYSNRRNDELLKASIEHVNSFLRLLSQNGNKTYDRKGNSGGNRPLFDRTA